MIEQRNLMPKITGIIAVKKKLQSMGKEAKKVSEEGAVVGYTQNYALIVHEDLGASHEEGKSAKYLEGPARELKSELAKIIGKVYKKTRNMGQALLIAALRLQRESQEIVPIDTSALKASAFTSNLKNEEQKASEAFMESEQIRLAALKGEGK